MRSERRLGPFRGVVTARGSFAPEGSAAEAVNARARGGGLTPRNGFQRLTLRPSTETETFGLVYLAGYDDAYRSKEELVLFRRDRDRDTGVFGPVRPYAVALPLASAPVATALTNEGAAVELSPAPIQGFTFGGHGYLVQPGQDRTVWRHEIGNAKSFGPIADQKYEAPPKDPTFAATVSDLVELAYDLDQEYVVFHPSDAEGPNEIPSESQIELRIKRNKIGGKDGTAEVTVTYPEPHAVPEGARYFSLALDGALAYAIRKGGAKFAFNPAQGNLPVTDFRITGEASTRWAITGRLPAGMPTTISGFKLTFKSAVQQGPTGKYATMYALQLGGELLNAKTAAQRPWDTTLPRERITYGARMGGAGNGSGEGAGNAAPGEIKAVTLEREAIEGPNGRNSDFKLGQRVTLAFEAEPTSGGRQVEFLRKTATVGTTEGVWKLLGRVAADPEGDAVTFVDTKREEELSALQTVVAAIPSTKTPIPPFTSAGIQGGVPYKGWVVWLFAGGRKNLQHSRFGEPLELRAVGKDYPEDDTTRPAVQSLADGFDDEPVAGFQAGQTLVILGKRGAYTSYGDYPAEMVPPRRVPETSGVVGPRACCRWKGSEGGYGVAWLDAHGNVWSLLSSPQFEGDASARPDELSLVLRGNLRGFLAGVSAHAPWAGDLGALGASGGTGDGEPGTGAPETDAPGTDNPGQDDPGTDDPGTGDPSEDDPGEDDPGEDDPAEDDPGTDGPGTGDPGTDDPGTEPPDPVGPGTGDPGTPKPNPSDPGSPDQGSPDSVASGAAASGAAVGPTIVPGSPVDPSLLTPSPPRGVAAEGDLAGALMGYDEAEDSLFVINGGRAAVFRPRDAVEGAEHVELYVYDATEDAYHRTQWTPWSAASDAPTQSFVTGGSTGDAEWAVGPPDRVALAMGGRSKRIERAGFLAGTMPSDAYVMQVEARVIETSTGDVVRFGRALGSTTGTQAEFAQASSPNGTNPIPFGAGTQLHIGLIEAHAARSQIEVAAGSTPPRKFTLGTLPDVTRTSVNLGTISIDEGEIQLDATYTGTGTPPPSVGYLVEVVAEAGGGLLRANNPANGRGTGRASAFGVTDTGPWEDPSADPPPDRRSVRKTSPVGLLRQGNTNRYVGVVPVSATSTHQSGYQAAGVHCQVLSATLIAGPSEWGDPLNWTLTVSPGTAYAETRTSASFAFTIGATYNGPLPAPSTVRVSVLGSLDHGFNNVVLGSTPASCTIAADTGLGPTATGALHYGGEDGYTRFYAERTGVVTVSLSGRSGSKTLTMTSTISNLSMDGQGFKWITVEALVSSPTLVPLGGTYSGRVEMRAFWRRTIRPTTGRFTALAFAGPALYALRSDAAVVALERDARTGAALRYDAVAKIGIDAGRPMPPGFWRFGDAAGDRARLAGVRQVLDGGAATAFSLVADGRTVAIAPGTRRWTPFPPHAAGSRMAFRIDFDQTLGRLDGLTLELTRLTERRLV